MYFKKLILSRRQFLTTSALSLAEILFGNQLARTHTL